MTVEQLLIKILGGCFVAAVFGGVAFLLRFLYGPGGKFRDPKWDAWNEDARKETARREEAKEYGEREAALRSAFLAYADGFFSGKEEDDAPLRLKVEHTLRVALNAELLAEKEEAFADPRLAHALRVAALLHDVGRFEQIRRYHTFADKLSCDHGALGVRIVREQGFLRQETPRTRGLVLAAVAAHNRLRLPRTLSPSLRPVLLALRDADKLDILRVMADNLSPGKQGDGMVLLHLKDDPEAFSPAVLRALEEGRIALYDDMRCMNDFRILLCTWLHDLHFATSFAVLRRQGFLTGVIDGLSALPELRAKLHAVTEEKLARSAQTVRADGEA